MFQFWLLASIVVAKVIASSSKPERSLEPYYFEAKRVAERILPERYRQDIALKIAFYTIAIAEASHRPKPIRSLERLLSRVGLSKTTGLMQVKSKIPLSDEESVLLAADMIEAMWLRCLAADGKKRFDLKRTKKGYKYNLEEAGFYLYDAMPIIYRKYNGSADTDVQPMLEEASEQVLADLWITGENITIKVNFPLERA